MPRLNTHTSAPQSSISSSHSNSGSNNTGSLENINTAAPSFSRVPASNSGANQNPQPYMRDVNESPTHDKTMTVNSRQRAEKSKLFEFVIKSGWSGVTQLKPLSQLSKKTGFNNFLTTAWLSILTLSNFQELEAAIKDILPTDSELLDDIKEFKESGDFGGLLGKKGNLEELLEFKKISIALLKQLAEQSSDVEYSEHLNHEIETLKNEETSEALLFALHDCFNKSCSYYHNTGAQLQILTVVENDNQPVMDGSNSLYSSQKADIVLTKIPLIVNENGVYCLHYHQTNENEKAPDYAPAPIIPEESQAESPTENSPVSANTPTTPLVRNASITYVKNPVAARLLENPDNRRLYGGRDVSSKSYSSVQHMIQCTSEELKTELPHLSSKQWKISPYGQNDVVCSGFLSIFSQLKPADIRNKLNFLLDSDYPYHDTAFEDVFNAVVQTASHFNKKNIQTGGVIKAYNVAEHLGGLSLYESTNLRRAFDLIMAHFPLKELPVSYTQDECITDEHLRLSQTINKLNPTYHLLALHAFFDVSLTLSMHHPKTDNAILIRFDNSFKNMPFEDRPSNRFQAVPHIRVQFVESARQNTLPMEISFTPAQKQIDEANAIASINRQNANNQVQLGTVHASALDQHIEQMHRPSFYICCNLNASISMGFKSRPQTYIATAIQSQFTHAIGFKPIESDNSLQANLDAMAQKGQALLQFSNKI